jgi:hypothetical protein
MTLAVEELSVRLRLLEVQLEDAHALKPIFSNELESVHNFGETLKGLASRLDPLHRGLHA